VTGISQADWTTVIKAMMGTMSYGTGHIAFAKAAYSSGGKTGTAQLYSVGQNEKYNAKTVAENLRDDAWFVAFAPAEEPRIAIAVLAENAGFGSGTAAPIARTVLDAYLLGADGKLKPEYEPSAQAKAVLDVALPPASADTAEAAPQ
jgi:penicillin-binding protein 2